MLESLAPDKQTPGVKAITASRVICFAFLIVSSLLTLVLASYTSFCVSYPTYDAVVLLRDDIKYEVETGNHWQEKYEKVLPEGRGPSNDKKQQDYTRGGRHTVVRNWKNPLLSNTVLLLSLTSVAGLVFASGLVKYGSPIIGGVFFVLGGLFFVVLSEASPSPNEIDAHITTWAFFWSIYYSVLSALFFALGPLNSAISRMTRVLIAGIDEPFLKLTTTKLDSQDAARVAPQLSRRHTTGETLASFLWNSLRRRQQQSLIVFAVFFALSFIAFACTLPISAYTAAIVLVLVLTLGLVASGLLRLTAERVPTHAHAQGKTNGAQRVSESNEGSSLDGSSRNPAGAVPKPLALSEQFEKRFRVAFSFAGEKRDFVSRVAAILATRFGEAAILYDRYHQAELCRSDLGFYLPRLYHDKSELIVVVLCGDYENKEWCGLEWDAIFGMLRQRRNNDVMLCRFDSATVAGLYSAGFVDLDDMTPEQVAKLILQRLELNEVERSRS
jgi:TIR domain